MTGWPDWQGRGGLRAAHGVAAWAKVSMVTADLDGQAVPMLLGDLSADPSWGHAGLDHGGMDNTQAETFVVRRAAAADAAALTRLREVMLSEMGMLAAGGDPGWRDTAEAWFARRLDGKDDFAAFLIEDPNVGVVSCAAGVCDQHAPGPGNPGGVQGLVFNMSTDPQCRRRGYARACLNALLAWFRDETQARVINLNTTGDGIALYRSLGFTEPRYPVLQLRLARPGARH